MSLTMTTISIVHTKGGVGKTTTAMYLATASNLRGIDVAVVDADPQKSATAWWADAEDKGALMPFEVITSPKGISIPSNQLVIVDTPPGESKQIDDAILEADLIIVPCGPTPLDAQRVWPTLDITVGYPTTVLMTSVDFRTNTWEKVREHLESGDGKHEPHVAKTMIPRRQAICKAFGTVPGKFHGYDDLLTELIGNWND